MRNTVEERILRLQDKKRLVFEGTARAARSLAFGRGPVRPRLRSHAPQPGQRVLAAALLAALLLVPQLATPAAWDAQIRVRTVLKEYALWRRSGGAPQPIHSDSTRCACQARATTIPFRTVALCRWAETRRLSRSCLKTTSASSSRTEVWRAAAGAPRRLAWSRGCEEAY